MNTEQLTLAFERGGDAPEHVQRLRKLVVASAITGRIEKSGHFDNPYSIMNAVEATKAKLFKAKEITKPKIFPAITEEDLPTDFNPSLVYVPLGQIARVEKGLTGIKDAKPGAFPLVVTAADRGTCDHHDFTGPAAIVPLVSSTGHGNASINRLHYQEGEFALGTILAAILPYDPQMMSARFLFEYLTAFKEELLVSRMTGSANVTLTIGRLSSVPVPVVCPSIQQKVQELMALLDGLEAARGRAEGARDKLTAATLHRLTDPDIDPQTATAFALQTLPALTTRPDQIKPLRQTILNLAVQGRLVAQDPADEPVLDHLGGLSDLPAKSRKLLKPLAASECGGDLPRSWAWLPLGAIIRGMDAGWSPQCENHPRTNEDEWGVLKTTAVQSLSFDPMQHKLLPTKLKPRPESQAEIGDILVTRAGPKNRVGISCVVDVPCPRLMISDKLIRFHALGNLSPRYIALTLNAGFTFDQIESAKSGMAVMQMNISQGKLRAIPIPLPPLAEQHRIVANVDALMALCDQLETALTTATTTRSRLLDTLIRSALSPDVQIPEDAE